MTAFRQPRVPWAVFLLFSTCKKTCSENTNCYKSCGNSSVSNGYIPPNSGTVYYPAACAYNSANTVCNSGYNLTAGNVCALICGAGVTKIRAGDLVIPLYASKQTAPAIHVNVGGKVCYGNLSAGNAAGALNVNIGGEKYHSVR